MPYTVPLQDAQAQFPQYTFVAALTPSEQKAAFHVRDAQGVDLCLKIISPNYSVDRVGREIVALQGLAHQNVVRLLEYTYSSTAANLRHYMVEEFVEGSDLANRMTGQPWLRQDVADLFATLCDGLAALDNARIVHRDLKPTNIRIRPNGSPVIIDFGLARVLELPALTNTAQGAAIGTPAFFAPEQFIGTKYDIDHRTDLFAVGTMMFECLVGAPPFAQPGMSYSELGTAVTQSDPFGHAGFAALPNQWQILLRKLLAKDRVNRPAHANQVAGILRKIRGV